MKITINAHVFYAVACFRSDDDVMESLTCVHVTQDAIQATNDHAAMRYTRQDGEPLFSDREYLIKPDKKVLTKAKQQKALRVCVDDENMLTVLDKDGKIMIQQKNALRDWQFPNMQNIWSFLQNEPVDMQYVPVSAKLLELIAKPFPRETESVKIMSTGDEKPLIVEYINKPRFDCLVMPVYLPVME
jgi:hypothetical protein